MRPQLSVLRGGVIVFITADERRDCNQQRCQQKRERSVHHALTLRL
jgi:hypothetical protein